MTKNRKLKCPVATCDQGRAFEPVNEERGTFHGALTYLVAAWAMPSINKHSLAVDSSYTIICVDECVALPAGLSKREKQRDRQTGLLQASNNTGPDERIFMTKSALPWVVTPCSLVEFHRHLGGTYCVQLRYTSTTKMEAVR
jgi:hypothetical protein